MGELNGWKIVYENEKEDLIMKKKRRVPEDHKFRVNLKKRVKFNDWLSSFIDN